MSYQLNKNAQSATWYVCSLITGNRTPIANAYHLDLLRRYKTGDALLMAEMDIVATYLKAINPPQTAATITSAALHAALAGETVQITGKAQLA